MKEAVQKLDSLFSIETEFGVREGVPCSESQIELCLYLAVEEAFETASFYAGNIPWKTLLIPSLNSILSGWLHG